MISADGRFVSFQSTATNLHAADADVISDVFVRGLSATVLASRADGVGGAKGNSNSFNPSISANGQWVAFESVATNLNGSDADAINDIYLRDVVNNQTLLVSRATGIAGAKGNSTSSAPFVSATGQFVVFESAANNLVAGDSNGQVDIFLRDRIAQTTVRVNVDSLGAQATGGGSFNASISEDGRFVVFQSSATNLVTPNTTPFRSHVYVRDMLNGTTTLVDNPAGIEADGDAANGMISADGRFIAFDSAATNLVPGDTNTVTDVFRFTMSSGAINRVSVTPSGVDSVPPTSGISRLPHITATGTAIVFESRAKDLISPPELGSFNDIYRSGE
jgi:Tol biopolymer transport system component